MRGAWPCHPSHLWHDPTELLFQQGRKKTRQHCCTDSGNSPITTFMQVLNGHRYNCGDLKAICACLHPKLLSCASRSPAASCLSHSFRSKGASWRQRSRIHAAITCRAPVPDNTSFLQPKPCTDAPTGVGSDDGTRRPRA